MNFDFLQSTWFMWLCVIFIGFSFLTIIFDTFAGNSIDFKNIVMGALKLLLHILMYVLLPVVIIVNLIQENKIEKRRMANKDSSS